MSVIRAVKARIATQQTAVSYIHTYVCVSETYRLPITCKRYGVSISVCVVA